KSADGADEDPFKRMSGPPVAKETGPFSRKGELIPDMGISPEMMRRAFEAKPGELIGPLEIADSFVVATVKDRKEPDRDYFDKHKDDERAKAERTKAGEVFRDWAQQRCTEARDQGKIKVNDELLTYEGLPP